MSSRGIIASCFWGAEGKSPPCALSIFSVDCFFPHFEQEQEQASSDMENVWWNVTLGSVCCVSAEVLGQAFSPSPSNLSFRSSQESWKQFLCTQVSFWQGFHFWTVLYKKIAFMILIFFFFHRGSSNPAAPHITVGLCNLCCCFHTNKWNKVQFVPTVRSLGIFFSSLSRDIGSIKIWTQNSI